MKKEPNALAHTENQKKIDTYIAAATRENTRISYRAAVTHFEQKWGGFLPATADNIAQYLAHYASSLAHSTLKQRLAALSVWHKEQGFADPTKAPHVKKVLKGIGEIHPHKAKQAKPLQLEYIQRIDEYILNQLEQDTTHNTLLNKDENSVDLIYATTANRSKLLRDQSTNRSKLLRDKTANRNKLLRDRAIILLGFWRAFRSDEITRLRIEDISYCAGQGLHIHLQRSKSDRLSQGTTYRVPALSQLCPVKAYEDWLDVINEPSGAVFCAVDRWGNIKKEALHPSSIISIIKEYAKKAEIKEFEAFSSHSLRRGFASWANHHNWSMDELMRYVGWKDIHSAMRYIDQPDAFSQNKIEQSLNQKNALT